MRRAVIDIGTNSIKLLVGDVSDGLVRPIDERSDQTRLGAGFYESHLLQPIPIARTAEAVARFVASARDLEAMEIRVIATSAARDARNPHTLTEAVRRASGLRVDIISGDQEAEWVFRGVTSDPRLHGCDLLILDVGGGSTEFILGDHGHYRFRHSFDMGSVRLLERFPPGDPPTAEDLHGCRAWLDELFDNQVVPNLRPVLSDAMRAGLKLVGTGGTTTLLARMENQMTDYDRERLDGMRLGREQILQYMTRLWGLPLARRREIPGLPANRADIILMGVAIYEAVLRHLGFNELYVSTRGLRFGALLDHQ